MKITRTLWTCVLALQFSMAGCAATQSRTAKDFPKSSPVPTATPADTQAAAADAAKPETKPNINKTLPGSMRTGFMGQETKEPGPEGIADGQKQKIVLNFDKADVVEVTNQIFGEYLKFNYVMDPSLRGQISLYLDGEFTKPELLQLITRAYVASNIDIVPEKGLYHIQTLQRTPSSKLTIGGPEALKDDKYGTKPVIIIYRLRYLDATQAMNTLKYFITPGRTIGVDAFTNSIMMVEDSGNARTLIEVLKTIDINILKEVGMEIVQVKAIQPEVAVQNLEALMSKLDVFKNSKLGSNVAMLPLTQLGAVLIIAQNPDFLKTAREWLVTMDMQGQEAGEQVYVHFVQNGLARDIANILGQLYGISTGGDAGARERIVSSTAGGGFGGGSFGRGSGSTGLGGGTGGFGGLSSGRGTTGFSSGSSSGTGTTGGMGGSFGTGSSGIGGGGFGTAGTGGRGVGGTTGSGVGATGRGVSGFGTQAGMGAGARGQGPTSLTGPVAIIPDEVNNAIVIKANAADYAKIKATILALDIVPRAVLIEVLLAEITLTKDFQYGIEWFFKDKGLNVGKTKGRGTAVLNNNKGLNSSGQNATITGVVNPLLTALTSSSPGLSLFWTSVGGDIATLIRLLSSDTNVRVLSNPTLLAMDNQQATITVGGREPILSQQSLNAASDTNIINSIQYEETGIILNVIPHINSGGLVRMEVEQTIRNTTPNNASGIDSPAFTERHVQTSLIAQDGKTAVIGGIIQQTENTGKSGIPFLRNVPLLGPLWSSESKNVVRTELIVAITPHVVKQGDNESSREFLRKLKQLRGQLDMP